MWERADPTWEGVDPIWEGVNPKRCFSVNANLLQGHCKTVSAVDKQEKTVGKFDMTAAKGIKKGFI